VSSRHGGLSALVYPHRSEQEAVPDINQCSKLRRSAMLSRF